MKRSRELTPLSHDHHHGLVHAHRLQKAAAGDEEHPVGETAVAFLDFWRADTRVHFRKEEEALLPVMARYGVAVDQEPVVEMLLQHARIRGLVLRLADEVAAGEAGPETLREIGELLEEHIRLEERVVFPLAEESLPKEALAEVAARLEDEEARA
jgi:hemerythrin-like domain-containing protein